MAIISGLHFSISSERDQIGALSNGQTCCKRVVFPIIPWSTIDRREMFRYQVVPGSFDGFLNHCIANSLSLPRPMRSFLGKDPVSRVL
ncbi:hypothetical protein IEQ34_007617 [Dendrobium chrysotoxum]|uniref:Uncharacterized protein n=1 Tax=Dendrobium chrysotoxum TaxID=161865 RepID=A0AAV7GMD4_DENCH|nr:hypothetical protein IEQ34_007617 [Dendrobium chrysotoxum]